HNSPPSTDIYTLSLHDALPISRAGATTRRGRVATTTRPARDPRPQRRGARAPATVQPHGRAVRRHVDSLPRTEESPWTPPSSTRSEEHTSELQSRENLVCRLLL